MAPCSEKRSAPFYTTLGILAALMFVVASLSNGFGLHSFPKLPTFREFKSIVSSYNEYTPIHPKASREKLATLDTVEDILTAIKSVTAAADVSGDYQIYGDLERELWQNDNPCRSRTALPALYAGRKFAQDALPNSKWQEIFDEYATMHRTCMSKVGDIEDYFLTRNTSTACKFLVVELPKVGLGNKLLFKASAILFAVLTQRVLLIPDKLGITEHLCEPFSGSSWKLPESSVIRNYNEHHSFWQSTSEFQRWVDKSEYNNDTLAAGADPNFHAAHLLDPYQPLMRYYCDTEQAYMSKVTWMSIGGCLYFLPKIFSIPAFRHALEDLFPDRMALTHVLRSVLLPSDPVWERIENVIDVYLRHNQRLIGVQLRYFGKQAQYKKRNDLVNERVLQCAIENGFLPAALPSGQYPSTTDASGDHHHRNTSKVFIASLFSGLHDHMRQIYLRRMTESGEGVGVVQLTHENEQHFGPEVDIEAFVEIMCLSLSDALFVTPVSTFGGVAQAYGALKPWFINFDADGPACERAQTVDVCFDQASEKFICPHDPEMHRSNVLQSVPYIQRCLKRDAPGLQLITDHESNPSS